MTKYERRNWFWNMGLNGFERKRLKDAKFKTPEDFSDVRVVELALLDNFGFVCTGNVLAALCDYHELPVGSFYDSRIEPETFVDIYSDDYNDNTELLIYMDFAFADAGYADNEKLVRITIGELLGIKGVCFENIRDIIFEIMTKYYALYLVPANMPKATRDDLLTNHDIAFSRHQITKLPE